MNGDIEGPSVANHPNYNKITRDFIIKSDGISTDGPMGFWKTDFGKMREADISLVRFAHSHGKKAMIMISPFGAHQAGYDPKAEFLTQAKSLVHLLESSGAQPDIYSIFEYATDIATVPEALSDQAQDTTTGVAFWLLHHLKEPKKYP